MVLALATLSPMASANHAQVPANPLTEGCVATWSGDTSCEWTAPDEGAGNIVARGVWTVKVWWDGDCHSGNEPDWIVSSDDGSTGSPGTGNNLPGGVGGTWEGSIAAGSCARAVVLFDGSVASIGRLTT